MSDPKPIVHGTVYAYRKRGCRCDLCKKAKADKAAVYYQANIEAERGKRREYARANSAAGRERARAWRVADPARYKAQQRRAYIANQAERAEYRRLKA